MDYPGGVIVLDSGSSSVKVGYAGEDLPRSVFPSVLGHPIAGSEGFRKPAPPSSLDAGCGFDERQPIVRGKVEDWDQLEKVWGYALSIGLDNEKEGSGGCPVMLSEAPLSDPSYRNKAAQYLFESAGCPALCVSNSAVLSLFASGRTRGVVIECGGGITCAVPIFEGFALDHATQRINLGGQDVTAAVAQSLRDAGFGDEAVACAQQIKEKCGYLNNTSSSLKVASAGGSISEEGSTFELPDGTVIDIQNSIRCTGPNSVLFPSVTSSSYIDMMKNENEKEGEGEEDGSKAMLPKAADPREGVAALILSSVNKCDEELIPELWGNIVVAGGGSMLPNFPTRIAHEIQRLRQDNYPYGQERQPIRVISAASRAAQAMIIPDPLKPERGYNSQRAHAAWVGGSMFGSLDTFSHVAVTKAEWEEHGEVIMQRKCF